MDLPALIHECASAVDPVTVAAIVQVESAANPYAVSINYSGGIVARQPTTKQEAIDLARTLITRGHTLSLGLMQINTENLGWLGLTLPALFDPCVNVQAGTRVLQGAYQDALAVGLVGDAALKAALSAYNTGKLHHAKGVQYAARVYAAAEAIDIRPNDDPYSASSAAAWTIGPTVEVTLTPGWQTIDTLEYGPEPTRAPQPE